MFFINVEVYRAQGRNLKPGPIISRQDPPLPGPQALQLLKEGALFGRWVDCTALTVALLVDRFQMIPASC